LLPVVEQVNYTLRDKAASIKAARNLGNKWAKSRGVIQLEEKEEPDLDVEVEESKEITTKTLLDLRGQTQLSQLGNSSLCF